MREVTTVPDPLLCDQASRWIEAEIGLHFPPMQLSDLQRRLTRVADRLGCRDATACLEHLVAHGASPGQRQVLAECLTVGETYFFRDQALFDQLSQQVLQPLIAARRTAGRRLRLWSAGCSTGEEAWSLAMLVAGLLPDWRDWQLSILATDLNTAALDKARAGAYGAWSLRGSLPSAAVPYLVPGKSGGYEVTPEIRRMVRFASLNLAAESEVAAISSGMDLILCRNVLMYFAPARRADVLRRLGRCLADGGWMVTNPVEIPSSGVDGLTLEMSPGLVALRQSTRLTAPAPATARSAVAPANKSIVFADATHAARLCQKQVPEHSRAEVAPVDAEAQCRQSIQSDKLNPEWTYRLSCILAERGDLDGATSALRRTLYLAPGHVLARFALGTMAVQRGQDTAGRRHFSIALTRLDDYGPGEVIEGSGGLTARELVGVIRQFGGGVPC